MNWKDLNIEAQQSSHNRATSMASKSVIKCHFTKPSGAWQSLAIKPIVPSRTFSLLINYIGALGLHQVDKYFCLKIVPSIPPEVNHRFLSIKACRMMDFRSTKCPISISKAIPSVFWCIRSRALRIFLHFYISPQLRLLSSQIIYLNQEVFLYLWFHLLNPVSK